jgi:hypothetical protein
MRRGLLVALVALVGLPSLARADVSVTGVGVPLDARSDQVLSISPDGRSLWLGTGTASRPLPIPALTGAGEFGDAALGTDSRGRGLAIYSRCSRGTQAGTCRLYAFGLGGSRQERVGGVTDRACSELSVREERGVVVFFRDLPASGVKKSRRTRLRRRCRGLWVRRPGHRARRIVNGAVDTSFSDFDLDGGRVAYLRNRSALGPGEEDTSDQLRVFSLAHPGRQRVIARGSGSTDRGGLEGTELDDVTLRGGYVYWQRSTGNTRADVLRQAIRGGRTETLARAGRLYVGATSFESQPADSLLDFAVFGDQLLYAYDTDIGVVKVALVKPTPPPFR